MPMWLLLLLKILLKLGSSLQKVPSIFNNFHQRPRYLYYARVYNLRLYNGTTFLYTYMHLKFIPVFFFRSSARFSCLHDQQVEIFVIINKCVRILTNLAVNLNDYSQMFQKFSRIILLIYVLINNE